MAINPLILETRLTKKDFESGQEVRWCPGCGDYAILSRVQKTLADMGTPRENHVFVAGIGCSSRFPYYMNTYAMHTIHGRAPTFATGVRLMNPDLKVWIITGDGDSVSIGGNHFVHLCRRNINVNLLLFNNEIYGLTKGQYSPTSPSKTVTKSSPLGSLERPLKPLALALGADATFVARVTDRDLKNMDQLLLAADRHAGTSIVEILQNCIVHNDGVYDLYTSKETKDDNVVMLEAGKPLIFGKAKDKGIRLNAALEPEVVTVTDANRSSILVHDPRNAALANILVRMEHPLAFGVFLDIDRPVYEADLLRREQSVLEKDELAAMDTLFRGEQTWDIAQ